MDPDIQLKNTWRQISTQPPSIVCKALNVK